MDERAKRYAEAAGRMLKLPTVYEPGKELPPAFRQFYSLLEELFPNVYQNCRKIDFDGSFLLIWEGEKAGDGLALMSHHDVVPATGDWRFPPFSGEIHEEKLWGRGALDVKGNLFCMLEAAEELIGEGYRPEHTVYLISSCMEEVGGNDRIADYFRDHDIHPSLLLDEGSPVLTEPFPGASGAWALVSVAEKGNIDVRFTARGEGGHSMAPPKGTPLPRLGAFMAYCEEHELFPLVINDAGKELLKRIMKGSRGGEENFVSEEFNEEQAVKVLGEKQAAMLSTTMVFTMAQGSPAPNVIPTEASVVANLRLSLENTVEVCMERLQEAAEPYGIEADLLKGSGPSPVSDCFSPGFTRVEKAVGRTMPGVRVLPYILSGGTDTRHFHDVCGCCLRFTPFLITPEQQAAVHGKNEHIDCSALPTAVDFFKALIQEG